MTLALLPLAVRADDGDDARRARRALLAGEALPLMQILKIATRRVPGEVVKVELDSEHGKLVYEIKILAEDGRLRELKLAARDGRILEIENDD